MNSEEIFQLHPHLERDCFIVGDFKLCRLLLLNNALFPWVILVPRKPAATELFDLSDEDQQQLLFEINLIAKKMKSYFSADKMNIATLGNQVVQLHIHVIARSRTDPAWPNAVWGKGGVPYTKENGLKMVKELQQLLEFTAIS